MIDEAGCEIGHTFDFLVIFNSSLHSIRSKSIPAAHREAPGVCLGGALRAELVPGEVGIVRGVDPVVREGPAHVLANLPVRRRVE